ncbi:putative 43kDa postsynaptic protein [Lupinus albus]|uniref:Putative 43kDa postsynaptic protein n=1 Tax=Lupinus albus TaxID=3870 RepID=A0A6A4PZE1_LUPAL|nr:putative 43kDa postsynaptic protein [Lupinus albus]
MKKHGTWPYISSSSPFSSLPFSNFTAPQFSAAKHARSSRPPPSTSASTAAYFSSLPYDILIKIAASFDLPNLRAVSLVCRSWSEAVRPLREAMMLLQWGKRFKHGRGGFRQNAEKALESFLKAAARGSALAMVDAGLMYWEMGEKDRAVDLYLKAAELGNHAAQCNLGLFYLQAEPPNTEQALKWLYKASIGGNVRSQYQLALCLHRCGGVRSSMKEAAKWYRKAAEGGYVRAMYNTSLCYSFGEGLAHSRQQARKWMKRAADRGHRKAQFEHGLALFSEGDMMKAVVYLELATRAGETGAAHIKSLVLNRLSAASRDHAMCLADSWRALPST